VITIYKRYVGMYIYVHCTYIYKGANVSMGTHTEEWTIDNNKRTTN